MNRQVVGQQNLQIMKVLVDVDFVYAVIVVFLQNRMQSQRLFINECTELSEGMALLLPLTRQRSGLESRDSIPLTLIRMSLNLGMGKKAKSARSRANSSR